MERVAVPEGVTFESGTVGGISGWLAASSGTPSALFTVVALEIAEHAGRVLELGFAVGTAEAGK